MRRQTAVRILGAAAAVWIAAAGGTIAQQRRSTPRDVAEYLPPGPAKEMVASQCSNCHDYRSIVQPRKPPAGWEAIVLDMVGRGMPLMVDDVDPMVAYLADVFGPTSPPLTDVNAASRDELLKLSGLTGEQADRLIAHRASKGPLTSRDDVRTVTGMDQLAFDKIKWYLNVAGADSPSAR